MSDIAEIENYNDSMNTGSREELEPQRDEDQGGSHMLVQRSTPN